MNNLAHKKVLCFGELLLRICPDPAGTWLQQHRFPVYIGGAELNVASALAIWDIPAAYFTALPENSNSIQLYDYLERKGIDMSRVIYQGERLGLYYLSMGTDMKNAEVIYDRKHSSYAGMKPGTIDWEQVFEGVSWFHFSAICPAINENIAAICMEALVAASRKGIQISLDLNYRSKLWQYGKSASEVMQALSSYCHLIMGNIWAAELMLGITITETLLKERNKEALLEQAERSAKAIQQCFPRCESVANTFRFDQAEGIQYYTALYSGNNLYVSKEYHAEKVKNKVGSGDCYMAGLIYGYYHNNSPADIVEFATAAAYDKLFIEDDATDSRVSDIRKHLNILT